jgi:hypothetical protein
MLFSHARSLAPVSLFLKGLISVRITDRRYGEYRFGLRCCQDLDFQGHQGIAHVVAGVLCDSLEIWAFVWAVGFLVPNCGEQTNNLTGHPIAGEFNRPATAEETLLQALSRIASEDENCVGRKRCGVQLRQESQLRGVAHLIGLIHQHEMEAYWLPIVGLPW